MIFQNQVPILKYMQYYLFVHFLSKSDVLCIRVWPDADVCECQEREALEKSCMYVGTLPPFHMRKITDHWGNQNLWTKKSLGRAVENMIFSI